jgi:hypothetical protein
MHRPTQWILLLRVGVWGANTYTHTPTHGHEDLAGAQVAVMDNDRQSTYT